MVPQNYEYIVALVAGLFLAVAQTIYIVQVYRKQITPSLFTWLGWAILVGVSLYAQLMEYGWNWSMIGHLSSFLGCTAIFIAALLSGHYLIVKKDWIFLYTGFACIALYAVFTDPWSTTIFAVTADAVLGMPTILKAIKNPKMEKTIGWNIALGCWTLTLVTCWDKSALFAIFPAYCFVFNVTMSYLTTNKRVRQSLPG
ncbi:MAG: hypothetical protein A3D92_15265 [Bacteroidetes bacterium RIFCSPHIGHO2_02_FULL_44_7]|nr:MAG: hypothetical protein A3D92_15265 [Bacteroidetes bacterium RIFCSPHIGHO2_02_FULL_44_7]